MSKTHKNILEKISLLLEVAGSLTKIRYQFEKENAISFQVEKTVKNLRKSVVIWSSHLLDHFRQLSKNPVLKLTEKEKSILRTGIATPINQALILIEKLSSFSDVRSLTREILILEQAQQTLTDYLNRCTDFIRSSSGDEECAESGLEWK